MHLAMTRKGGSMLICSSFHRQGGGRWAASRLCERFWVPAFAGNTDVWASTAPRSVIASVAKQPRGLTRTYGDVPLGCFGAMHLAMTRA